MRPANDGSKNDSEHLELRYAVAKDVQSWQIELSSVVPPEAQQGARSHAAKRRVFREVISAAPNLCKALGETPNFVRSLVGRR